MKITNNYNLPYPFHNVMNRFIREPSKDSISCTTLIKPVQITYLERKHWDEMEDDCSNMLWALLGSSVAYILEHGVSDKDETRASELYVMYKGDLPVEITGRLDLLEDNCITDYKVPSVYSFLLGEKLEWEQQLNIYRWLLYKSTQEYGKPMLVDNLQINAILRDWMRSKSLSDKDYPKIPFVNQKVEVWDIGETEEYVKSRIALIMANEPIPCTDEERWLRNPTWAVMKKGAKKATKVCDSLYNANLWISTQSDKDKFEVVHRKGTYNRCEGYCRVSNFCTQWAEEKKNVDSQV